jgi:hypothetical protein
MSSIQDENSILRQELNKVEDYLLNARAERDELIVKYNALNDRVSIKMLVEGDLKLDDSKYTVNFIMPKTIIVTINEINGTLFFCVAVYFIFYFLRKGPPYHFIKKKLKKMVNTKKNYQKI